MSILAQPTDQIRFVAPVEQSIPVILIGVFDEYVQQMTTLSVGAAAYLQKPFHPEALDRQLDAGPVQS